VAVGDFTGTGIQDLAAADDRSAGTVSVLLGNGDGTFQPARAYAAGNNPVSVAVGDLTGNGILDLVVADTGGFGGVAGVEVLLGNGDGTFQPARTIATGFVPASVAVGDFNGDGIPDLAIAAQKNNTVNVLLGNGDGTFQNPVDYAVGDNPFSVAVGDFNHDGTLDLAVANFLSNNVSVLLGNGNGTFQPARNFAAERNPAWVTVGDFTGDGRLDLAVANAGSDNVSVLLGNGDGSFQRPHNYSAGSGPLGVAAGDFIGDGIQDLAVANFGSHTVSVLLGVGDGSFVLAHDLVVGGARQVVVGDFTGAGIPDLAVAYEGDMPTGTGGGVSVLLGNGTGRFQAAPSYAVGQDPESVAVGDVTGTGIQDLAVANSTSNTVSVLLGNGDGSFRPARNIATGLDPLSVAVGDFTGTGIQDLAVASLTFGGGNGSVSVFLGNGDGTFQPPVTYAVGIEPEFVAAADFTGNGILDLVVANSLSNNVSVLLGNGDGTFQTPRTFSAGREPVALAVGDFNGDGIPDLAVADEGDRATGAGGGVSILRGNGDGTFQAARRLDAGTNPSSVAVGDFNGDGTLDIAVADRARSEGTSGVSVLLGNGDGTFQPARTYLTGTHPRSVAVGDFTGAGILDLALAGSSGTRVLLGNGDGTFQNPDVSYVTGQATAVAIGDFHGNGLPDLAVAAVSGADTVFILANDGIWDGSPGAPGSGRTPGAQLKPRTEPALPRRLLEDVRRIEAGAVSVPAPRAAVPLVNDNRASLGPDADHGATPAGPAAVGITKPMPRASVLVPARAPGMAAWLIDRLLAEPEADGLWNPFPDAPSRLGS
jgi:hypothetical protein